MMKRERERRKKKRRENPGGSDEEFRSYIRDIALHPAVLKMKDYPHHGVTSCYQHCLNVAYYNYRICKFLGLDARAAARAGMLHDLFLYDWHTHARETGNHIHGLTHPWTALKNARKYFAVSELEREMIVKHMWPLTVVPPTKAEAVVICLTDKYCSSRETISGHSRRCFRFFHPLFCRLIRKVFGKDYVYRDVSFSSVNAAEGDGFVQLRRRPSENWKRGSKRGKRRWR